MKLDLTYDAEHNLMHQILHGDCDIHELAEIFDKMDAFSPRSGLKVLTDITDADLKGSDYTAVSFLEAKLDRFLDKYLPVKKAIIAASDLEYGIARMYEIMAEKHGYEVGVFRSSPEAIKWLERD